MPIHVNDSTDGGLVSAAAWLRFVEEENGKGIRGALLHTSEQSEPLAFCFTRLRSIGSSSGATPDSGRDALSTIAKSLLRADARSPALIFGLISEIPPQAFTDDLQVGGPICLVGPDEVVAPASRAGNGLSGGGLKFLWMTEKPEVGSYARRFFDAMVEEGDPFEPFERVGKALNEAFADRRIQAVMAVPGLTTVVNVSPLIERSIESGDSLATADRVAQPFDRNPDDLELAKRIWKVLAAPREFSLYGAGIQLEWPGELMPFQQDGVRALLERDRLLLADDMGLGKTLQAIAALRVLYAQGTVKSCLIVTPASILDQWRKELYKWAPELGAIIVRGTANDREWQWGADAGIKLVSYDTLRSDSSYSYSPARKQTWDVVVADEAQRIKNRNDTSNALKELRRSRSWALTGTPIENHEAELASILEFVDHGEDGQFKHYWPGDELYARHRELQLRRKKGEVLDDLPPKQVSRIPIHLTANQRRSYDRAENEGIVFLKSLGAEVGVQHVFELITRLKQICNADPETGESTKLEDIRDRLGLLAAQGHKALVFSQYIGDASGVGAAARYLREFNPLTITGDIPQQERVEIIDLFKTADEHKALVLSLRAGGLGLNLQEASYVFHLDRWWNPAVERQAEDRSHRIGQTVKVNVIKYSCSGTIEERIDKILDTKQELFSQLIDDVSLDMSTHMNREELFGLFDLKPAR